MTVYTSYETGLHNLLVRLGAAHPRYVEALTYQQRLSENIAQARIHGDPENRRAERSEIIGYLNIFALTTLGISFNDLCILPREGIVPPTQPGPPKIAFVNRLREIDRLTDPRAPQYQFIDAPAGYGKTDLLKEIARRYQQRGWMTIYAEIPYKSTYSMRDVVEAIVTNNNLSLNGVQADYASERWIQTTGYQIAECLHRRILEIQRLNPNPLQGVILLIDRVEVLGDFYAEALVKELVPGIQQCFKEAGVTLPFRTIFAGRYISTRWSRFAPYAYTVLSPFDFSIVEDAVRQAASKLMPDPAPDVVARIAAHLMHITGGHPGCMARMLEDFDFRWMVNDYLISREDFYYYEVVLPTIYEIRRECLRDELNILCTCRRFTPPVLRGFIEHGLIQHDDEYQLDTALTQTYLVTRAGGFLQDGITRRLLAVRMRHEYHKRFLQICEAAREIYAELLVDCTPQSHRPEVIAIELLWQQLLLGYFRQSAPPDVNVRSTVRDDFWRETERILPLLVENTGNSHILDQLRDALQDDWEFQFTLNYYLRGETYDRQPYADLLRAIENFKPAL